MPAGTGSLSKTTGRKPSSARSCAADRPAGPGADDGHALPSDRLEPCRATLARSSAAISSASAEPCGT